MVVILHNIRSLHNVGSIFRTADAVGAEKIYLCGITPEPFNIFGKPRPELVKVSLGAEGWIPWDGSARSPQAIRKLLESLKKEGFTMFAIEQSKKSMPYNKVQIKNPKKIALILGNEASGLPNSILKKADKIIEIPMAGRKESLNVSVAFGIAAYSLTAK